jgi:hypothetical protein
MTVGAEKTGFFTRLNGRTECNGVCLDLFQTLLQVGLGQRRSGKHTANSRKE